ncbi:MAG: 3'-5' exonuclease [Bacteroidia bacterium]
MYKTSELKELLFFDIETLPKKWCELSEGLKSLWIEKYHYRFMPNEVEHKQKKKAIERNLTNLGLLTDYDNNQLTFPSYQEIYTKYAGLYAEFSRVWCISFGALNLKNEIEVNTLQEEDEKEILEQWLKVLIHYDGLNLAGYNINDFDIPFLLIRMFKHGLTENYPRQFQLKDAKPWTTKHVDFMQDWKTTRRESVSLSIICELLEVPTPKDKFNNDQFTTLMTNGEITVKEGIEYCEKDVVALVKCMLKCSSDDCNFGGSEKPKWTPKKK